MKKLIFITFFYLIGCATQANLDTWVGSSRDELILTYGAPSRTVQLDDGSTLIEFSHQRFHSGNEYYCTARFLISKSGLVKNVKADGNIGGCNRLIKAKK